MPRCRRVFVQWFLAVGFIGCTGNPHPGDPRPANSRPGDPGDEKPNPVDSMPVLLDLNGAPVDPLAKSEASAMVFLFTRTDCPISNRYAPEVRRLHERFHPLGVEFYLVYVDPEETVERIHAHLRDYNYPCPALLDPKHKLVQRTGASVTPEAALFSRDKTLVYVGRIDDWYVDFGKSRAAPSTHELTDAIVDTLEGKLVSVPRVPAIGCYISDLRD